MWSRHIHWWRYWSMSKSIWRRRLKCGRRGRCVHGRWFGFLVASATVHRWLIRHRRHKCGWRDRCGHGRWFGHRDRSRRGRRSRHGRCSRDVRSWHQGGVLALNLALSGRHRGRSRRGGRRRRGRRSWSVRRWHRDRVLALAFLGWHRGRHGRSGRAILLHSKSAEAPLTRYSSIVRMIAKFSGKIVMAFKILPWTVHE